MFLGLLLDLDDLVPSDISSASVTTMSSPLGPDGAYAEKALAFKPLPKNPHALLDVNAPTFPRAVSLYRRLILELAVNPQKRLSMGQAGVKFASTQTWHRAMERLVTGYQELASHHHEETGPVHSKLRAVTLIVIFRLFKRGERTLGTCNVFETNMVIFTNQECLSHLHF